MMFFCDWSICTNSSYKTSVNRDVLPGMKPGINIIALTMESETAESDC